RTHAVVLVASYVVTLLAACAWSGQRLSSIPLHFFRSFQLAAGYSSAMAVPAAGVDLFAGFGFLAILGSLIFALWLGSAARLGRLPRVAIVSAGLFLAWKEGFVRPDVHVVVFLVYAFLVSVSLPALLGLSFMPTPANGTKPLSASPPPPPAA